MYEHAPLTFPLNVYAHCLWLDQGQVEYLHYGLFERPEDDPTQAQQRSTALILQRLPPTPAAVLEIGPGLGTTAAKLGGLGYSITALTPDAAQIAIARQRAPQATFHAARFEDFHAAHASFDVVLLQESAQYLDALALFANAFNLLREDGQILIVDEFAHTRGATDAPGGLPCLRTFLVQAGRYGFAVEEQVDLSSQAAPTVDYLLRQIRATRTQLLADLPVTDTQLNNLLAALEIYRSHYQNGSYGYFLLRLRKHAAPRWRISVMQPDDAAAVRGLFNEVFAPETLTPELWQWKYGNGRGLATLAWRGARLVAHYGGLLRLVHYFGVPAQGVQIGDVMTSSAERGVLTRHGAFYQVAATFPERWVGYGARCLIGYGFPNTHAMRVAEKLGLYAATGRMAEVRWPAPRAGRARLLSQARPLDPLRDASAVDALWQAMAADLAQAIVPVRSWADVHHRYLQHPHNTYQLWLIRHRLLRKPLGLLVLRQRENGKLWLLDYIGPLRHAATCLRHAQRLAARQGYDELQAWITTAFASVFTASGAQTCPCEVVIPTSIHTPGPAPQQLHDRWWLMAGDTDFF